MYRYHDEVITSSWYLYMIYHKASGLQWCCAHDFYILCKAVIFIFCAKQWPAQHMQVVSIWSDSALTAFHEFVLQSDASKTSILQKSLKLLQQIIVDQVMSKFMWSILKLEGILHKLSSSQLWGNGQCPEILTPDVVRTTSGVRISGHWPLPQSWLLDNLCKIPSSLRMDHINLLMTWSTMICCSSFKDFWSMLVFDASDCNTNSWNAVKAESDQMLTTCICWAGHCFAQNIKITALHRI